MKAKRLMSAIVAMILVICTLLTSCQNAGNTPSDTTSATTTTGASTTEKQPDGTTSTPDGTTAAPDGTTSSPSLPNDPADNCAHTTTVKKNVKAATCAVKGYTGDDVCSSCGIVVTKGTETDLIDHVYDNGKITKEPTCIEQGVFTYTCTGCGTTKIDSLGKTDHKDLYHDYLDGTHSHTCENCTLSENAAHTPKDAGVLHQADCLSAEYTEHTCSLCNGVYKVYTEGSVALGCSFGDWSVTKDATCSADGEMTRSCSRCQEVEKIAIPASEAAHSYSLVNTFPASCSDEGTERYKCAHCEDAYSVTIPKIAHNFSSVEAVGDGWTHKLCDCGYKLSTFDAKDLVEAEVKTESIPEDNSFEVSLEKADIVFPETVVSQFKDAEGDLSIKADVMPESHKNDLINAQGSNLTQDQKDRLADVPVYDFGVKLGGEYVESFESEVSVTLPYTLKDGEDAEGIVVWYVKEDGSIENVTAIYNESAKTVTFSVSHFSFYAIAYEETQEMRCKRGNHAYYATPVIVTADCTQHGYTLYECECCHYKHISDIVEKKNHSFGNVIQPTVDCVSGGYTHRICDDCGYTVNIDYIRAKGHTPGSAATCETPCVCTDCNTIIIPAKSHSYTDWETVKAPTGSEEGIKRRYCTNCGKAEERAVPPTGLAEKTEFKSYGEFYNYIFKDLLQIEGGTLSFDVTQSLDPRSMSQKIIVTIENDGTNYSILVERRATQTEGNVTNTASMYILVRNGMMFELETSEDGSSYIYISSGDSLDVENELAEELYEMMKEVDFSFSMMFEFADAIVTFGTLAPDKVNELFAKADLEMDLDEFASFVDKLKAEYVYTASLFGYDSEVVVPEGVKAGGISNLLSLITGMMTNDGNGKYSYLLKSLLDAADELVATYDKYAELPVFDALYDLLKDDILEKYPDLTSRAAVEAKLRESFPGTMKFSEAVDKIMTNLCGNDADKLNSVYEAINTIAKIYVSADTEFDVEAMILEYADYTLDRFVQEMMDYESFAKFLDDSFVQVGDEIVKTILGHQRTIYEQVFVDYGNGVGYWENVPVRTEFVENEAISTLRTYLTIGKYSDGAKLEVAVKDNGLIDSINGSGSLDVAMDKDSGDMVPVSEINPATPDQYVHMIYSVSFSFKEDKNAKLTLPALLNSVKDTKIELAYDANGNIVITSNTTLPDFTFGLNGYASVDLASLMVKDNAASAEAGFDVYYTSDSNYWDNDYEFSGNSFIKYNGKFYNIVYHYTPSFTSVNAKVALKDLMANPLSYVNVTEEDQDGYVDINGEKIPVYDSFVGLIYQFNGEWMLINDQYLDYTFGYEQFYEDGYGYFQKEYKIWYDYNNGSIVSAKLTDVLSSISLSNVTENHHKENLKDENGNYISYTVKTAFYSVNNDAWKEYTIPLLTCIENDGTINILITKYVYGRSYYCLGTVADVSQYKDWESYTSDLYGYELYDQNMNLITDNVEVIRYERHVKVPRYYAKVGESFVELRYLSTIPNISYSSITLPDSTKLYVVLEDGNINNGVIYGYTQVSGVLYAETACYFENGVMTAKYFHYAATSVHRDFYYDDISSYVTKDGNKYVISADLIKDYTAICNSSDEYAYFNIYARSDSETAEYSSSIRINLYRYSIDHEYKETYFEPDWWRAFENVSKDEYNIKLNDDGTLSFWFGDGSKITMTLDRSGNWIAVSDDLLTKDNDLSAETGLNVGTNTTVETSGTSYLYVDGKYYWYSTYAVLTSETVSTVKDVFHSIYYIDDIYYRYDFDAGNGKIYKIYHGTVKFDNYFEYSPYIDIFFTVNDDGKLMILTGAEELGESVLKFDGIVEIDDYFNSLVLTYDNAKYNYTTNAYINGAFRDIYQMYVEISEHDASGNRVKHVGYFYACYYLVGNTRKFITNPTNSGNGAYVKKESLATLPNNVVKIELEELVGYNGVFSIAHVEYTYTNTNTYIEIDGTYYYYNDYRHAYMSEYDALRFFGDLEWKYVAWNPQDANYYLCELVSIDKYVTITNIGNVVYNIYDQGEVKEIGLTKDKWIVYETSLFSWPNDLTTETRPDGTVFYSRNGENRGVIKCPDGKYFEAEKVMMNDGSTKIVPINLGRAELYVNSDVIFDHLKSYITFSSGNMVVTFSPDLLTAMEKLFGRSVYDIGLEFCFRSESGMQYHLSLYELAEYFGYSRGNNDKYDKYEK